MPFWTRLDQTYTDTPNTDPHEYIVIDIDNDGDADLVQALFHFPLQDSGLPLRVLLNNGAGQFTDGTSSVFPGGAPLTVHPRGYIVDDFNGDGRDDLFIVDHGYDVPPFPGAQNTLVLSSGLSGMIDVTATNIPAVTDFTHSVAAGDVDGDGDVDFVVMNVYGGPEGAAGNPYVLLNDGAGAFTRDDTMLPSWVAERDTQRFTSTTIFDADNDGDLDIFLGSHGGLSPENHSFLLLNPGDGDFSGVTGIQMPAGAFTNGNVTQIVAVTTGDLNGDGREDLVAVRNPDDNTRSYQILINRGAGVFTDETASLLGAISSPTGSWTHSVQLVDLNSDGHLDMITRNGPLSPVFMNDGTGRLVQLPASFFDYGGWGTPDALAHIPADVNGDGRLDIIASAENGFMFVFVQQEQGLSITGTAGADGLLGDSSAETLSGGDGADVIFAAQGNDRLVGGAGNDVLDGGTGVDTAGYAIASTSAAWTRNPNGTWTVTGEGADTLSSVEYLDFTDRDVFLDRAQTNFSTDGRSDFLLRNEVTGSNVMWFNGNSATSASMGTLSTAWSAQGYGDFNGDGRDDILWRNTSNGNLSMWFMNNQATVGSGGFGIALNWQVSGIGDVNGDLRDDIVLRNSNGDLVLWLMNGLSITGIGMGNVATNWQIEVMGDFNGDGRDDFIWRNSANGNMSMWLMNGAAAAPDSFATVGAPWNIAGVGDFNGDGRDDVMWRNDVTGGISMWLMNAGTIMSSIGSSLAANWSVADIGDYNGDGRDDIVWRNANTGDLVAWHMNGGAVQSTASMGSLGADWIINPGG